jgi:transcriptional regulator with XRE-family HTH domain
VPPMKSNPEIELLCTRLRLIRESKNLTLIQAASLSQGAISAIALGSYERGDRSISAEKLIHISQMYRLPVSELFSAPDKSVDQRRICVDLRKLRQDDNETCRKFSHVVDNVARLRRDWNGEIISLRAGDLHNLQTFSGLTVEEIDYITKEYEFPRVK